MSNRIFIDSDIVLDLLCKREGHYQYAAELFTLADKKEIALVASPVVFANVFYILRKIVNNDKAKEYLRKLRLIVGVVTITEKEIDLSLNSIFTDFEDGLQYFCSRENCIEILLTRNTKDYKEKGIVIQTPEQYLKSREK
mgnify:CR=1 FL=1